MYITVLLAYTHICVCVCTYFLKINVKKHLQNSYDRLLWNRF